MITTEDMELIIDGLLCLREVEIRNSESTEKGKKVDALIKLHKVEDLLLRLNYKINKEEKHE